MNSGQKILTTPTSRNDDSKYLSGGRRSAHPVTYLEGVRAMSRILNRWWEVQGRNGYWAIDEYRTVEGEPQNRGTYGTVAVSRKKEAELVCGALNEAYRHGRED